MSIAKNEEHININAYNNDSFLSASLYDIELYKLIYSQRNYNLNIEECGCFFKNLKTALLLNANDAFKYAFNILKNHVNHIHFFEESIKNNHEIANYILDLQVEEKKSNNLQNSIIFQNINQKFNFHILELSIICYNEEIIVKIFQLYEPLKLTEDVFKFVSALKNNTSKKMMISLFDKLISFIPRNLLICISALLRDNDCQFISDTIMEKLPQKV